MSGSPGLSGFARPVIAAQKSAEGIVVGLPTKARTTDRVSRTVADKRLLGLIRGFLTAGVLENGLIGPTAKGTPQGGPLSPLLSNLMLDVLDRELEKRGHRFVRYADDCVPRRHEEAWMI